MYETGRVELALAASVVVPPTTSAGSWPKVIDWASRVTDVVRVEAAPAYVASPAWVAVTEQVPSASAVRVEPEIEQTAGVEVAYVTARPELAVAVSGVVPPTVRLAGRLKVIDWASRVSTTALVRVTELAADRKSTRLNSSH